MAWMKIFVNLVYMIDNTFIKNLFKNITNFLFEILF